MTRKVKKPKLIGRGGSPGAAAPSVLLRSWGSSSANLHQKKIVNMVVKELCEIENEKGVISEGFGF